MANRIEGNTLILDTIISGSPHIFLRYDQGPSHFLSLLSDGCTIAIDGATFSGIGHLILHLGDLDNVTVQAINMPAQFEYIDLRGKNVKLTGRTLYGETKELGHHTNGHGIRKRGSYGITADGLWSHSLNLTHFGEDYFASPEVLCETVEVDTCEIRNLGFAGVNAKNDNEVISGTQSLNFMTVTVHHCYIHDTGGEPVYLGYSVTPVGQHGIKGHIHNNIIARGGNEMAQLANLCDGFVFEHNICYLGALDYRHPFQAAFQDGNLQYSPRWGDTYVRHNIFIGSRTTIIHYIAFLADPDVDAGVRDINDVAVVENNLFMYSYTGHGYINVKPNNTTADLNDIPKLVLDSNFFVRMGPDGANHNGTGKVFGQINNFFRVEATDNSLDNYNSALTGILSTNTNRTETGTTVASLPLPKFVSDDILGKGISPWDVELYRELYPQAIGGHAQNDPVEYPAGGYVYEQGKLYQCLVTNMNSVPSTDVGGSPTPDANGETVGTNWKLIWHWGNGQWNEYPIDDFRLKSDDFYNAQGIGLEANLPLLPLTLSSYPSAPEPRWELYSAGQTNVPFFYIYYPPEYYSRPDLLQGCLFVCQGDGEKLLGSRSTSNAIAQATSNGYMQDLAANGSYNLPFVIVTILRDYDWTGPETQVINAVNTWLATKKKIDKRKLWATGFSGGADYIIWKLAINSTNPFAAWVGVAPYAGGVTYPNVTTMNLIAYWGITNDGDIPATVQGRYNAVNAAAGRTAETKKTIWVGTGHNAWIKTFDETAVTITSVTTSGYNLNNSPLNTGSGNTLREWLPLKVRTDLDTTPQRIYDLQAVANEDHILVKWVNYAQELADAIKLYRKENSGSFTLIATLEGDDDTYVDTSGITATNDYTYFAVSALGSLEADNSNEDTVTFSGEASGTAPDAPTGLGATPSETEIVLDWTDNADDETDYVVERKVGSGGTYSTLATKAADVETHTDATAEAGITYYYRVGAVNAVGTTYSGEVSSSLVVPYKSKILDGVVAVTAGVEVEIELSDLNLVPYLFQAFARKSGGQETIKGTQPFTAT